MSNEVMSNAAISSNSKKALSDAELRSLLARSKAGDVKARNAILLANMRLIYKIAGTVRSPYADREDLITDGCIRFLEIINEYNPDVASLSTYVWRHLVQYMNSNVRDYKAGLSKFIVNYNETVRTLREDLGRRPEHDEIADYMGISVKVLKNRLNDVKDRSHISLYTPADQGDPESATLLDSRLCSSGEDASTAIMERDERESIMKAWGRLSEEEQNTLSFRVGEDGKKISLREAAQLCGESHETIRSREVAAKRHFSRILEQYGISAA